MSEARLSPAVSEKKPTYELETSVTTQSTSNADNSDFDETGVKRGLHTRHLSMMALAGIIGPGLLVGAGQALNTGGPAALLIGFGVIGILAACMMQSVGELSTLYPSKGGFITHTERFVNKPAGFVCGWNYVVIWVAVMANEYNAIGSVMEQWSTKVPIYGYILLFWALFLGFQMLGVRSFGEAEFWLALIKIIGLLAYFIFSLVYVSGGVKHRKAFGFHYFNDPGAFSDGFRGVAKVFIFCSTFYAGTESVAMAATETRNPIQAVPKAIRQVFGRILFVYMGSALFFGMTCPWNAPELISGASKALKSPMTIAIQNAGWHGGYHLINAFLLVTCISGVNSSIYIGSRTIFFMAQTGNAPRFFQFANKRGVPVYAIIVMNLLGLISLMNISEGATTAYNYIVNLSGVSTFIVWGIIALTHLRFRRGWKLQGYTLDMLPFKALLFPYAAIFAFGLNLFLSLVQGWTTLSPFKAGDFVDAYILLPVSALAYFGAAWYYKQVKWHNPHEIDFDEGRRHNLDDESAKAKRKWFESI